MMGMHHGVVCCRMGRHAETLCFRSEAFTPSGALRLWPVSERSAGAVVARRAGDGAARMHGGAA